MGDVDVDPAARPADAASDERRLRRGAGRGWRLSAIGVLIIAIGGVVVLVGGEPDGGPATTPPGSAEPDEAGPDPDASGPHVPGQQSPPQDAGEGRPEGDGTVDAPVDVPVDAPVVPASTGELPEDTYCWWDGVGPEKCHVWAVDSARGAFSHVVAAGERVIVAVGNAVVALDGSDGAVSWIWRDEVPTLVDATSDRVFVTDGGGRTVALDAATGAQVWEAELREGRWLRQTVRDGVVVNREPSSMTMFAAGDGTVLGDWNLSAAGGDGTPVIADEVVTTVVGEELVAYSRTDGERLWQAPLTPTLPPVHWPGVDVIVVAEEDRLSAVDIATGAQVWTRPAEHVEQLADIDAGTVAVAMPDRADLVDRHTGATVTPVHAPEVRAIRATGDTRFFSRVGRAGVKLWQTDPIWPTWNLHAWMPMSATYVTIDPGDGETYVVAPVTDGATVVAFDVWEHEPADPTLVSSCDGARPSWHLGQRAGWAGEQVQAAVIEGEQQQLVIGIPGAVPTDTSFTVSARPLGSTGTARFSRSSDDWRQELVVDRGGRTADGFPPHWVVGADFDHAGCWELRIEGEDVDDIVVLPVPAGNGGNG